MVGLEFQEKIIMAGGCLISVCGIYISTPVARGQDGAEVKSMIDLVLVKKAVLCYVHDARAVRGRERGLSDHHTVLCRVKLVGT